MEETNLITKYYEYLIYNSTLYHIDIEINYDEIPNYLKNSELYKIIKENWPEMKIFPIRQRYYKENDIINSDLDFIRYIETYRYWLVYSFSDNCYEFMMNNSSLVNQILLLYKVERFDESFKAFYDEEYTNYNIDAPYLIGKYGDINWFNYYSKNYIISNDILNEMIDTAIQFEQIELLKIIIDKHSIVSQKNKTYYMLYIALRQRKLKSIKFMKEYCKCNIGKDECVIVLESMNLECFKYVIDNVDYDINNEFYTELLTQLKMNDYNFGEIGIGFVMEKINLLEILKYYLCFSCECIDYLKENNIKIDNKIVENAKLINKIDVVEYINEIK